MLRKIFIMTVTSLLIVFTGCSSNADLPGGYEKVFKVQVINSLNFDRSDAVINLDIADVKKLYPDFNANAFAVFERDIEIASQVSDTNVDGVNDLITFVKDVKANENSEVTITYNTYGKIKHDYSKRTQAEVSVKVDYELKGVKYTGGRFQNVDKVKLPDNHEDHNAYLRYEGPAWESEKVGYRLYLDARTRTDIWGKKVDTLVLQDVGVNDLVAEEESYQSMMDWGMDIFKVGKSLGIGSIVMPTEKGLEIVAETDSVICYIASNGVVRSEVLTKYYGWQTASGKYDFTTSYVINAGSRLTEFNAEIDPAVEVLATGLAKYDNTTYFTSHDEKEGWRFMALYGAQTLAGPEDKLGIVLFYKSADEVEVTEDELSYVVKLKSNNGNVNYYFAAAWEQEKDGIKNIAEFKNYIDGVIAELDTPVVLSIK